MAFTVTYTTSAGMYTFNHPTLTVSHSPIVSASKESIIATRQLFTIRFLLCGGSSSLLDQLIEEARYILSIAKGTLNVFYDGFAANITASPETDIYDGPLPGPFNVERFHGGKTAEVTWQLETEIFPYDFIGAEGSRWVDFVYTISTAIDMQFYAYRTVTGFLRLPSNNTTQTADAFRLHIAQLIPVPPEERGFWQRIRSEWRTSEDNRTLFFTITDQQRYVLLPEGCTDGDASIHSDVHKDGSATYTLQGYLVGPSTHARIVIHQRAYEIMQLFRTAAIVGIHNVVGDAWTLLEEQSSYTTYWQSNRIDFFMRWSIFGFTASDQLSNKLEFLASTAANWFAYLSRQEYSSNPTAHDAGPYGTSGVCGLSSVEETAPIFGISWDDKLPAKFTGASGGTPGNDGGQTSGDTTSDNQGSGIISCTQAYAIRVKRHLSVPLLSSALYNSPSFQMLPPEIFLLCTGEMITISATPTLPPIAYPLVAPEQLNGTVVVVKSIPDALLIDYQVQPVAPLPDGTFCIRWSYILRLFNYQLQAQDLPAYVTWPYNPQVLSLEGTPWNNYRGDFQLKQLRTE